MDGRPAFDLSLACRAVPGLADRVPVRWQGDAATFAAALATARARGAHSADLPCRLGSAPPVRPAVALSEGGGLQAGTTLTLSQDGGALCLIGCPDRLSPEAFALIGARLQAALTGEGAWPAAERSLTVESWNATATPYAAVTMAQAFEAQAARTPQAKALTFERETLTYAQLNARAGALAQALVTAGVGPGALVGLMLPRGIDLVAGALAIHKAGGAYLPLDPSYPADRIALYVQDSGAAVILTQRALVPQVPSGAARLILVDEVAGRCHRGLADVGCCRGPTTWPI